MGHYDRFESEDDVYEFCIERRREADAMVRAEELRLEREQGVEEGIARLKELAIRLKQDGRIDELVESTTDTDLQKKLLAEYQL